MLLWFMLILYLIYLNILLSLLIFILNLNPLQKRIQHLEKLPKIHKQLVKQKISNIKKKLLFYMNDIFWKQIITFSVLINELFVTLWKDLIELFIRFSKVQIRALSTNALNICAMPRFCYNVWIASTQWTNLSAWGGRCFCIYFWIESILSYLLFSWVELEKPFDSNDI